MKDFRIKSVGKHYSFFLIVLFFSIALTANLSAQTNTSGPVLSPNDKKIVAEFEKKAKDYAKLRARVERGLPKVPKKATPGQIEANKIVLQKSVQNARAGAQHGDIFTPDAAQLIRTIIKSEFKGIERAELRKTVLEAETKGVPLKVNAPYPEEKELVEMSPALLLALPQLPKQLRYRYVARNLLLVDRESGLIIDYMTNALP